MEALVKIKEKKYDLIFMDHMMPEMDGVETTKEIRNIEIPYCKDVPVVALTANSVYGVREELLQSGFSDYLAKPIDVGLLEAVLNKYFDNCEASDYIESETDVEVSPVNSTIAIEGIDSGSAMQKMNINETEYLDILSIYHTDLSSALKRIISSKENGDIKRFTIDVHGVKSSSASIGALALSELAKQLEFAGKEDNIDFIEDNMDKFVDMCENLIHNLNIFFDDENQETDDKAIDSIDKQWMIEMGQACEDMDSSRAAELLEEIKNKKFSKEESSIIKKIKEFVNQYEYDEVTVIVQEFCE